MLDESLNGKYKFTVHRDIVSDVGKMFKKVYTEEHNKF